MSFNCEDDSLGIHHNHTRNNHGHGHGHDHEPPVPTNSDQSLFSYIDTTKIKLLNGIAMSQGSQSSTLDKSSVFIKNRDNKSKIDTWLQSDTDCQLVAHLPFTGVCKIDSIILRCNKPKLSEEFDAPKTIQVYKNWKKNSNIDFNTLNSNHIKPNYKIEYPQNVGIDPTTTTETDEDETSMIEFHMPKAKFNDCHSITLFFKDNWSDDEDNCFKLYYLEIRGSFTGKLAKDDAVPIVSVYESAPNPLDHQKVESDKPNIHLGM
ncbi:similar to Torulaspora delbrueckii TDEL_0F02790 hypothetical protein [Maudiozyma barnettii]|uniref:PITH domain-containing protein n=1 Tax=Maudiozyma barnettii TaxID=61262 RepID=A0A8H2VJ43_9SACH|nr:uncharacterized protein KABA2_09S03630 [Kazachstania barnettii]CAB4256392.1 similar to Torulaspora delbrueckii TDEL_0F02790 hypothetical protein [Kazachstania barnettii]CAD1785001.1 similar to Torulaspora delbrueckii TDEL_0F02790 hypothetical protein [Kazachstania barnettii]